MIRTYSMLWRTNTYIGRWYRTTFPVWSIRPILRSLSIRVRPLNPELFFKPPHKHIVSTFKFNTFRYSVTKISNVFKSCLSPVSATSWPASTHQRRSKFARGHGPSTRIHSFTSLNPWLLRLSKHTVASWRPCSAITAITLSTSSTNFATCLHAH